MNNNEILNRLAGRMGTSVEQAGVWLEAVLEILHGTYSVGAANVSVTPPEVAPPEVVALPSVAVVEEECEQPAAAGTPVLRSVTATARLSIGDEIVIDRFPFRVGREGRAQVITSAKRRLDRQMRSSTNELYVKDFGKSVNVSREHFQIESNGDGTYELVDRGSACGTIVGNHVIGGNFTGGRCSLRVGDSIVVGTRHSSIVFEFGLRLPVQAEVHGVVSQ